MKPEMGNRILGQHSETQLGGMEEDISDGRKTINQFEVAAKH